MLLTQIILWLRYLLAAVCIVAAVIGVAVPFMPTYDFVLLAILIAGVDTPLGKKLLTLVPVKMRKWLFRKKHSAANEV